MSFLNDFLEVFKQSQVTNCLNFQSSAVGWESLLLYRGRNRMTWWAGQGDSTKASFPHTVLLQTLPIPLLSWQKSQWTTASSCSPPTYPYKKGTHTTPEWNHHYPGIKSRGGDGCRCCESPELLTWLDHSSAGGKASPASLLRLQSCPAGPGADEWHSAALLKN